MKHSLFYGFLIFCSTLSMQVAHSEDLKNTNLPPNNEAKDPKVDSYYQQRGRQLNEELQKNNDSQDGHKYYQSRKNLHKGLAPVQESEKKSSSPEKKN